MAKNWQQFYPIPKQSTVPEIADLLFYQYGLPNKMVTDNTPELIGETSTGYLKK